LIPFRQIDTQKKYWRKGIKSAWEYEDPVGGAAANVSYGMLNLAANAYPPDEFTEAMSFFLAGVQLADGGWNIYYGGQSEINASVKAYFALKLAGHGPDVAFMQEARANILRLGGIPRMNTFSKLYLALLGQFPWQYLPAIPVEMILLPSWSFFNIHKMSSWSRAMLVPLAIINHFKPTRELPAEKRLGWRKAFEGALEAEQLSAKGQYAKATPLWQEYRHWCVQVLGEQHPGTAMLDAAREHAANCVFNVRVTHASGMLEGKYTEDTVFPANDHRRHRPRSWLTNGLRKIRTLDFLTTQMSLGQAALKWLLAEPTVVTVLPNIYDMEQLREFAAASDLPNLSRAQMEQVATLSERNFGVEEEPMSYKGTMDRVTT
jgi:hypothetical protein